MNIMNSLFGQSTKQITSFLTVTLLAFLMIVSFKTSSAQSGAQLTKAAADFRNPGTPYRPHMRMWIPQAAVDESVLRSQVNDLADAGVGDIELVAFDFVRGGGPNAPASTAPAIDSAVYGWGTPNWAKTMEILLDQAGKRGIKATFIMGPAWPIASPLLTKSSLGVEVQLACKRVDVSGKSYGGDVLGNINRNDVSSQLVAVLAGKRESSESTSPLEMSTMKDLTGTVIKKTDVTTTQAYTIDWTAPDDSGQWTLFFYWNEPVGETKSGLYVVDHFSKAGTKSVTDYYKSVYDEFAKKKLLQYGNGLFGDSLEYRSSVEFTDTLLTVFKKLKGYDLTPYLPAITNGASLAGRGGGGPGAGAGAGRGAGAGAGRGAGAAGGGPGAGGGIFGGGGGQEAFGGAGARIRNDYYDVLTYLFNENHLKPIQAFLEGYGQNLRYQTAYGKHMEQASTSMNVGIPEGEMMMIRNEFDNIRAQAGAVHMMRKREYNAELQAEGGRNHAQSWANLMYFVQRAFSAGVQNLTFHGYNYSGAFSGAGSVNGHIPGVAWPGWDAFGRDGYSNSWGVEPLWRDARLYMDFLARNSYVLKQGNSKIDLAVFRESFWDNASFAAKDGDTWYKDGALLQDKGYSYDFVALPELKLPNARITAGRLDPSGPAYKALILNQTLDTLNAPAAPGNKSIGVDAAKKVLELAKAGLPVVYIGDLPVKSTFYSPTNQSGMDSQVQSTMAELKSLKNVKQAPTFADVPSALDSLGVSSDAQYSLDAQQSKLISMHRAAGGIDYYYVYNRGFNANSGSGYGWGYGKVKELDIPDVSTKVTFRGKGKLYQLNTWTGEIVPVANYTVNGSTITVPVTLRGNESTVFALDSANVLAVNDNKVHATSSGDADVFYVQSGRLAIKGLTGGLYHVALSSGAAKDIRIAAVPSPVTLGNWKLSVEDWRPGATPTTTAKSTINVDLGELKPWGAVPSLQFSSCIGTYSTAFDMSKGWKDGVGAIVDLGVVNFAYRLKINGTDVKCEQMNTKVDIGPYVKAGRNTIEVEVATSLNNRLKDLYNVTRRTIDYYGLIGSGGTSATDGLGGVVSVTPYVAAVVQ